MKRFVTILLSFSMLMGMNTIVFASNDVKIKVNGDLLQDAQAVLKDGSTLLPVRSVGTALGGEVTWDNATKTASIDKDGTLVTITIGEKAISVNGTKQAISTPAQVIDGRTYVPLRALGEALECDITWVNETKTVEISQIDPAEYKAWYEVDEQGRIVVKTNINSNGWNGYTIVTSISVDNDDWRNSRVEWDTEHRDKAGIIDLRPRGFYSHYDDGTVIKSTDIYIFKGVLKNFRDSMENHKQEIAASADKLVYHTTLKNKISITEAAQPMELTSLKVSTDTVAQKSTYTAYINEGLKEIGEYDLHFENLKNYSYSSWLSKENNSLKGSVNMGFYPYQNGGTFSVSHTQYSMAENGTITLVKTHSNTINSNAISH